MCLNIFRRVFLIGLIATMAGIFENVPLVDSQGLMIISKFVKGDIPTNPTALVWKKVEGIAIPLSSQIIATPKAFTLPQGKSSVRRIRVKSLNNGKEIAFLLEWGDVTKNSIIDNTIACRDAVAVQFPVPFSQKEPPYFGMGHGEEGDLHMVVNIWQWKADLEEGREKERKGPVEDLNAAGYSSLTLQDSQDAMGMGIWRGGKWRVVLYRPMITRDKDDVQFKKELGHIAFAVWDGSNLEKDGQKSISTWHELKVE